MSFYLIIIDMISLKNISKIYKRKQSEDVVALKDISLVLPEKGFVTILGASGSGKTTLLNILGGLDKATSGYLTIDGLNSDSFSDKDWDSYRNQKIGFVLQNCYLLPHVNVRDNVCIKLQIAKQKNKDIDKKVDEVLKEVGLLDKKYDMPKALSGGQKQRVAIARAIIGEPTVILADEPTGALDSKTGYQIMDILKKISTNHLVVMVTHNNDYASKYADRVIELKDGEIACDSAPINEVEQKEVKPLEKVAIPLSSSLKWGLKNLIVKKYSTLSILISSAISLASIGLILSLSSGVSEAFYKAEADSFSSYPVTINSYSKQSSEGSGESYTKYTDEESVFVDYSNYSKQEHYNFMSEKFLTYMDNMPEEYYDVTYRSSYTSFMMYTQVKEGSYAKISSTGSLFYKGIDDESFISKQYDCLKGHFPSNENELALVVDNYNRVDVGYLYTLGFDVDTQHIISDKKFTFDEILNKTYHYITNEQYYRYDETQEIYKANLYTYEQFYNLSTFELKIVGIIREKRDNTNDVLRTGILYTPAFGKKVIQDSNNSQIVIDQKSFGVSKDVTTGQPFSDYQSGSTNVSKEYQYEQKLFLLGSYERVTSIYYFTHDYESRVNIDNYFHSYVKDEEVDFTTLTYDDYLKKVTNQFDGMIKLMTTVLYVFSGVSIFVAALLSAILTYISIHQRTSEIGLLRSVGARKLDIGIMVETEALLNGLIGGIVSIGLALILVAPVNKVLVKAIYQFNVYLLSKTTFDLGGFRWWVAPIMLALGLVVSILSALVPAIIASKKSPAKAINEKE